MYFFIVNPASHSGMGMQLWKQAEAVLQEKKVPYQVFFSEKSGDITLLAKRLTSGLKDGEERSLVVLGGDGTVNEAVNGIADFEKVRFSYIPTGSSNDLARDMGISRDAKEAVEHILQADRMCTMDIGCVRWEELGVCCRRRFVVSCGMGYDAAICVEVAQSKLKAVLNRIGLGKLVYVGIGLKQMLSVGYTRARITLDNEKPIELNRILFVSTMSHRYEGGGFMFCPQAKCDDGILDLCVAGDIPKWKFPVIIPFALFGKHCLFKGITLEYAKNVSIESTQPLWVHTDGEVCCQTRQIKITQEGQKLRFIY
ncbi:MAG: YegS/Rv2252/BmrU family lipid kinase [Lachnospiraceae bacterium]|nr:YegS/Rv2252/BmrU family lipid kinase [Lachnospiraceae bacterium]